MSEIGNLLLLAAIEVGGLFAIWFLLKARIRRFLEIENLLSGVREEARALVLELNQTADRNVSLVEDRITALRELLDEVDRRVGLAHRELDSRANEREVYAKLSRRRPIVPGAERALERPAARAESPAPAPAQSVHRDPPITLTLGSAPEVRVSEEQVVPAKTRREEALELFRRGISPELIATRLGATVAEIELLVEIEERRRAGAAGET